MKILHFLGTTRFGGVAEIVHYLARYHTDAGQHVDILSMCHSSEHFDATGKFENLGCKVYHAPTDHRYSPRQLIRLVRLMRQYDIVHIHLFPQQMWGALAALLARVSGKKPVIITTEHSTYNNRRSYPLLRYADRWMYRRYNSIVSISPATREALVDWLGPDFDSRRIVNITNGIDIDRFDKATPSDVEGFEVKPDKKYICWSGRLQHPKSPVVLLKALTHLPAECEAVIMGEGQLESDCKRFTKAYSLENRVHFLGNISDVTRVIKHCSAGVLSTDWEGFGLAVAEFMASGIPTIVSDVPGLRDVVDNPKLTFEPNNDIQLSECLRKVLYDNDFRTGVVTHCQRRVCDFPARRMADQYLDLYRSLLNE